MGYISKQSILQESNFKICMCLLKMYKVEPCIIIPYVHYKLFVIYCQQIVYKLSPFGDDNIIT